MPPMSYFVRTLLIVLSVSAAAAASGDPTCKYVDEYFPDCLDFLVGNYFIPPQECCRSVGALNYMANHLMGPRVICQCIEAMVTGTKPPLMASRIEALPKYCVTHLSFPISSSMDCSR
ncbi:non-specific lipid-transfer protein 13-like [Syzygium oleosum]|uniref:non-specific lipid-transfer protein 13-like n=1 Tax=Syzygium oleosum TaxID=219896 RepID=UPI0024B98D2C|nr:non-specific lipid-transfer protein 13-like [Syzygium oleosum]